MKKIGFNTTSFICKLGNKYDVAAFFTHIDKFCTGEVNSDLSLVVDRLRFKYVLFEDIAATQIIMLKIKGIFETIPIEKSGLDVDGLSGGDLNLNGRNLSEVFTNFFDSFNRTAEHANEFYKAFNIYNPIKIIVADVPECTDWERMPLEAYDSCGKIPLWFERG